MEDNSATGSMHMLPQTSPPPVLKTQANIGPHKGDIGSSDLNIKQGYLLLDSSNVSTPKMPSAHETNDQGEANSEIELPRVHLGSANDRDATMQEHCKGDFSPRLEITSHSAKIKLINNMDEQSENISPVLQQHNIIRPKTPPLPIPVTEIFSPNTVKQVRASILNLFPNGPPPPKPVIPVKRHKRGDTPYIVGCAKRRRVPENKSLSVFKGDDYGITNETNSFDNDEHVIKRKYGKKRQYANWSKSRFNPKSEEIAERLKNNEKVVKSPSNDSNNTASYMTKPYTPRPQAFSPLPSTSKDNETIMKNEKHFSESLRYKNFNPCVDDDDDDELPDIQWDSQNSSEKKSHRSLLQRRDIELVSNEEPSVNSEDLNNNNNADPYDVELCEIQFDKYMPKKEFSVPESTTTTCKDPIIIDQIDLDNVIETSKPKRVLGEIQEVIESHEIKDDYSSITYEHLYSVPKATGPVDVDKLFKDLENFQRKKKKMSSDIITIVDMADLETSNSQKPHVNPIPKQTPHNDNPAINLIPTQEPSVNVEARPPTVEVAEVIEIPDYVPGSVEPINPPTRQSSTNDVEFISETILESVNNSTSSNSTNNSAYSNSTDDDNNLESVMAQYFFGDLIRNHHSTHWHDESHDDPSDELRSLFQFLTDDQRASSFSRSRARSKKPKKPKALPQESRMVNNENAAPSTNLQTSSPTNGERRLGDCPICMDNLARGSIASTTCGHVFCLDCIKTCLRTNGKKCPTCRKPLKGIGYHLIFL